MAYRAKGGEFINQTGLTGQYNGVNHKGKAVTLITVRQLVKGDVVDLTPSIQLNYDYAK